MDDIVCQNVVYEVSVKSVTGGPKVSEGGSSSCTVGDKGTNVSRSCAFSRGGPRLGPVWGSTGGDHGSGGGASCRCSGRATQAWLSHMAIAESSCLRSSCAASARPGSTTPAFEPQKWFWRSASPRVVVHGP